MLKNSENFPDQNFMKNLLENKLKQTERSLGKNYSKRPLVNIDCI